MTPETLFVVAVFVFVQLAAGLVMTAIEYRQSSSGKLFRI